MAITTPAYAVLGFTYEADMHCKECSVERFGPEVLRDNFSETDSEGNPPNPIFACESALTDTCGTCHEPLWS